MHFLNVHHISHNIGYTQNMCRKLLEILQALVTITTLGDWKEEVGVLSLFILCSFIQFEYFSKFILLLKVYKYYTGTFLL